MRFPIEKILKRAILREKKLSEGLVRVRNYWAIA